MSQPPAALIDLDGTLVDSTYLHAIAWTRGLRSEDMLVPTWRLHRHIGMGGDQLVRAVLGDEVERERGDSLRDAHDAQFQKLIDEVAGMPGAHALVATLETPLAAP